MKTFKEISALLANRAEEVCQLLLPGGKRHQGTWISGDASGSPGESLVVNLEGQHVGKWRDWANQDVDRGDLLDLWRISRGLEPKEAFEQAKRHLGIAEAALSIEEKSWRKPKTDHSDLNPIGKIYKYLTHERKIDPGIIHRFQVQWCKMRFKEFTTEQGAIVFPCFSPGGKRVNNSYCALERTEEGKKAVCQDKGAAPCLFGWQALSEATYASRKVILCEGQIDAMSWAQWGFGALSVPNGSGTTWLDFEWENLEIFETIYLSFDSDGKTADALARVVSRLGKHRAMIVTLPHKDANDCLKAGCSADQAAIWIASATAPVVKDFVIGRELNQRVLKEFFPDPDGVVAYQSDLLKGVNADKSFAIRPAEVTSWTGISGHGKTAFLTMLFMLMTQGKNAQTLFVASFEMKPEKIIRNMIRALYSQEWPDEGQIWQFMDLFAPKVCFCDRIGSMGQEDLIGMMEFAFRRHGVSQFLIDSLMCVEGLEEDYPAQGRFLDRLVWFSRQYSCHVHLVVHPRKTVGDEAPRAVDLKGSSLLRNKCDNIVSVIRNVKKERGVEDGSIEPEAAQGMWDTEVSVEKDREQGQFKKFRFKYDWKHNRFHPMR